MLVFEHRFKVAVWVFLRIASNAVCFPAVVVENQSVMGNMSLSSTSVPAPAVECIDLTKETSAETSNTRQIWRMRHKQRDAQRAQLAGGSQPGSSSAPAAMCKLRLTYLI